jgi:murein DD-endopeptidase MepM/ murein hydrolase activator NlpD
MQTQVANKNMTMAQHFNLRQRYPVKRLKSRLILILALIIIMSGIIAGIYYSYNYAKRVSLEQALPAVTENEDAEDDDGHIIITTKAKDTLSSIFKKLRLSPKELQNILTQSPYKKYLSDIKPKQQIEFFIEDNSVNQLIIRLNTSEYLLIYKEHGRYINKLNTKAIEQRREYKTATIRGSLYGSAQKYGVPYKIVQKMVELFNWEMNFSKDIKLGDKFTVTYDAFYLGDKLVRTGDVIAVSYSSLNKNKTFKALRYVMQSGAIDYYTPEGTSLKKAFLRYPVRFSHISSAFSLSRYHPILHYRRPHKGIDLAAPMGTPIKATGDGRIAMIGRQNGYGNMIKIVHDRKYSTVYGHMLRFQRGLSKGSFVRQGQIIGYVGQSGLATSPHCHYEIHVNQEARNPATIDLPKSSPIYGRELTNFRANALGTLNALAAYERAHNPSPVVKPTPVVTTVRKKIIKPIASVRKSNIKPVVKAKPKLVYKRKTSRVASKTRKI